MADSSAATETPPSQQPAAVNGSDRLAAATPAAADPPVAGAAPAWPSEDPDPVRTSAPPPYLDHVATRLLEQTFGLRASMIPPPIPADAAQRAVNQGASPATVASLRALAAAGMARAGVDDEVGRGLHAAHIGQLTNHLYLVAGALESQLGTGATTVEPAVILGYQEQAETLYSRVTGDDMRRIVTNQVSQPPADASNGATAPPLTPADLRIRRTLERALESRIAALDAGPSSTPGVRDALAVALGSITGAQFDLPERASAMQTVSFAEHPRQTLEQLRMFADTLDRSFPDAAAQRRALRPFAGDTTLADHLRAIGTEVESILNDPATLAQVNAAKMFGTSGTSVWHNAQRDANVSAVPPTPPSAVPAVAEASATPSADPPVVEAPEPPGARREAEPTPYRYNPELMPEHALLGSLVHAPAILGARPAADGSRGRVGITAFLRPRDFSTTDTRAVYETLVGLHKDGVLFDVPAFPAEKQLDAAFENRRSLHTALRTTPSKYTNLTVSNVQELLDTLDQAAPLETLGTRSVYDSAAQRHLARMVLEDSTDRILQATGGMIEKKKPLVPPAKVATSSEERDAVALVKNLELIEQRLDSVAGRWAEAVKQTGPDLVTPVVAEMAVSQAQAGRFRLPSQYRAVTNPWQHRAERHLIHLALHSGEMKDVPKEVLDLSPEDFGNVQHANTWRTIKDLQARGEPVNYTSVFRETRGESFAHRPALPDRALHQMARIPELKPERISRSLRAVVSSALARTKRDTQHSVAAVAAGPKVPGAHAVEQAKKDLGTLRERAQSAVQIHRGNTTYQTMARNSGR